MTAEGVADGGDYSRQLLLLYQAIHRILDSGRQNGAPLDEPVNWADLTVVETAVTRDWNGNKGYIVLIAEASPDAERFQRWLAMQLAASGWARVTTVTEW